MTKSILSIIVAVVITIGAIGYFQEGANSPDAKFLPGNKTNIETQSQEVPYYSTTKGWYVEPTVPGDYPGVVMIHEWWGLNDNIKTMAEELARNGYRVLAVDMYGGKIAGTQEEAQIFASGLSKGDAIKNMQAAVSYVKAKGSRNVGAFGWGFGGGQALQLSMSNVKLDATVVYYGQLPSPTQDMKTVDAPLLGIFGDQDAVISVDALKNFEEGLNSAGIKNQIHLYPGVGHAFANPSGMNYAPEATIDAWKKTLGFLNAYLK